MRTFLIRSIFVFAFVGIGGAAIAQQNTASLPTTQTPKARCAQLLTYYERYGATRSEDSSGLRHIKRVEASIDCDQGRYDQGIRRMEDLLTMKHYPIPAPCTGDERKQLSVVPNLPGSYGGCS